MFERFTSRARRVVVLAQEEARKLNHNFIGTEHLLLGLLSSGGLASRVLTDIGMSLEDTRDDVARMVGTGKAAPSGHIPFTPRAKKTLELALREALQLHHNHIGTEHLLLGLIREGEGVAAQVMRQHADLLTIRTRMLDLIPAASAEARGRRWLRRRPVAGPADAEVPVSEHNDLNATPAADAALSEAARLAGSGPVGSHHLLLATLTDPQTAAARALAALGVDLEQARQALRAAEVTGTTDEPPEEAGRRQMVIHVSGERVTVEAADPEIIKAGRAAITALGDQAHRPGTIPGDVPAAAPLATLWQALFDSLAAISRLPVRPPAPDGGEAQPGHTGTESG
jgi:ATP-dependent Clp protease ATP-binding subunit ClpA